MSGSPVPPPPRFGGPQAAAAALRVADFDYDLPPELIAQTPLARRDASRLLVVDRSAGRLGHRRLRDLPDLLEAGDLLVANNSRVLPARLRAAKAETGGRLELLLLRSLGKGRWRALAKPARKLRLGQRLVVAAREGSEAPPLPVVIAAIGDGGEVVIAVAGEDGVRWEEYGEAPLPPYITARLDDPERYQTVYASAPGSAAAPTAGLHITDQLRARLAARGVGWGEVTLHVGLDTFRPPTVAAVADHTIHREWCAVADTTARRIAATRAAGGRVVAIGTTTARTLETLGARWDEARPKGLVADTDLFIVPGYEWRIVDGLLTNFHLPRSTLLMLVSALAGRGLIAEAYAAAIAERYRFFSFGDAMLIV